MVEDARAQRRAGERKQLFQRHTTPANFVGGYRFPDAPTVTITAETESAGKAVTAAAAALITAIAPDLTIPKFLMRRAIPAAMRPAAEVRPTPCLEPASRGNGHAP